jgi:phage gp45-like
MHRITASQSGSRAHSGGGGRLILDEVDDSKNMQEMKGTAMKGEAFEGAESPQNYGFTSCNAPADKNKNGEITDGAEGFMSFIGGNRGTGSRIS